MISETENDSCYLLFIIFDVASGKECSVHAVQNKTAITAKKLTSLCKYVTSYRRSKTANTMQDVNAR
jgi:hypothetical protein